MAELKPTLTLTGTQAHLGATLSLSVDDTLSVASPMIGISMATATTTPADNVILPLLDVVRYVYIKHTAVDSADGATVEKIFIESNTTTGDVTDVVMELNAGEFAFFPYWGGEAGALQIKSSADTVKFEYAYWTKA